MKWALIVICLFSSPLLFGQSSQDAVPQTMEQRLTNLSSNIQSQLSEAKTRSASLSQSLTEMRQDLEESRNDLALSQHQRDYYQTTSILLENSLQSTIQSFENLSQDLNQSKLDLAAEKEKVRLQNKILLWAGIIGGIIMLGKIAAFILYAKKVPIPRWLDIVL